MDKKILLVEPIKHDYIPIALGKISTYHKSQNDEVKLIYGIPYFLDFTPDKVYITSLFTWEFKYIRRAIENFGHLFPNAEILVGGICVSLLYNKFKKLEKKYKNLKLYSGLDLKIEEYHIDYSLFPDINYSVIYTTRGCPNKCPFCMVNKLEPNFLELKNWEKNINLNKKKIVLWDNNFLASSENHIIKVIKKLKSYNKTIDFNQGLDCRKWNEKMGKLFKGLKIHPLRFAFDNQSEDGYIQKAIKNCFKNNLNDISIYMLYNFLDKPEEIYQRLKSVVELKNSNRVYVFLMKYQPLDTFNKGNYVGKNWSSEKITKLRFLTNENFVNGIMRFNTLEHFYKIFGKNKGEFLEKLGKSVKYKKLYLNKQRQENQKPLFSGGMKKN